MRSAQVGRGTRSCLWLALLFGLVAGAGYSAWTLSGTSSSARPPAPLGSAPPLVVSRGGLNTLPPDNTPNIEIKAVLCDTRSYPDGLRRCGVTFAVENHSQATLLFQPENFRLIGDRSAAVAGQENGDGGLCLVIFSPLARGFRLPPGGSFSGCVRFDVPTQRTFTAVAWTNSAHPQELRVPLDVALTLPVATDCREGETVIGGLNWLVRCTEFAQLFVDPLVPPGVATRMTKSVSDAVPFVETAFGRPLAPRPFAFLVSTHAKAITTANDVLDSGPPQRDTFAAYAAQCCGLYAPAIVLDASATVDPDYVAAHEITHIMVGQFGRVPRWFNEGVAELEAYKRLPRAAGVARTCIAAQAVFSGLPDHLADIDPDGPGAYPVFHAAIRLLVDDVGEVGLVDILSRLSAARQTLTSALAVVTGRTLEDFEQSYRPRIAAKACG